MLTRSQSTATLAAILDRQANFAARAAPHLWEAVVKEFAQP
jgi:hypothetical protein